ncbi:MAG: zinc-binding dehydrogenase, partial [Planctomycetes bacterium]|nr:zinc-binding dehydrogenase [Planctomycetota bacterium]
GPSVVIEAVGLPETFAKAVELVAFAGRVTYIGYAKTKVEYDTRLFVSKELDIRGSRNALKEDFTAVIDMLRSSQLTVDPLITQRYPMEEIPAALDFWNHHTNAVTKILISNET